MLALVADENFNGHIVRGLIRRLPTLDLVRAQDTELCGADDLTVLEWAAARDRLLMTHDVRTVTRFAHERAQRSLRMPGVIEVSTELPIGQAIEELLLLLQCSLDGEWEGQVVYVPLR